MEGLLLKVRKTKKSILSKNAFRNSSFPLSIVNVNYCRNVF